MNKTIKVCLSSGGFFIHADQESKNHLLIIVNQKHSAADKECKAQSIIQELSSKGKRIRSVDIDSEDRYKTLHRFRPDYFYIKSSEPSDINNKAHVLFAKMLLHCGDNGIAIMDADNDNEIIFKLNSLLYPPVLM